MSSSMKGAVSRTNGFRLSVGNAGPTDEAAYGRRVLFVAYLFPPVGGAGVQRAAKFVKYLPQHGWLPSVLTASNPSVPLLDESLCGDIPAGVVVHRARTWEPGYQVKSAVAANRESGGWGGMASRLIRGGLRAVANVLLQPDPQILFVPNAIRAGRRLLSDVKHDAIVATGPPFSTFLAARALSRRFGIPLVLDYRDEWDVTNAYSENRRFAGLAMHLQRRLQARIVRDADAIVATTQRSAAALEAVRDAAGGRARAYCIYNGWDPDDFPPILPDRREAGPPGREGVYRVAYIGTLWNLTSVEYLVEGIIRLHRDHPAKAKHLELVFAGRRTAQQSEILARLRPLPCRVVETPYLNHAEAISLMRGCDGLLVLLADVREAARCVPAKLFEYMAAQRTIFGIVPPGEVWDLLSDHPDAHLCRPSEPGAIAKCLADRIERHLCGIPPQPDGWRAAEFARPLQAGLLAGILNEVCTVQ